MPAWLRCTGLFLLLPFVSGCGDASRSVPVGGTVSYRGEPLAGASITFFPASGRPIYASTSENGAYRAELAPDDYIATVRFVGKLPPGYKEGDPIPPPKLVLPPQYTTRAKSALRATVAPDQSEPIDFTLE
jgi:hypothetical protein